MQLLAQYFLGKRSRYETFSFDAVNHWQRLRKAVELCKDYGLTALSKRVYIANVRKNELPELQQRLRQLFFGNKDKLFLFMLCKSCLEVSSIPLAVQTNSPAPKV